MPFTSLLCEHSQQNSQKGQILFDWPLTGTFDMAVLWQAFKLIEHEANCSWDVTYMKECVKAWMTIVEKSGYDERKNEKSVGTERGSIELEALIDRVSKCAASCHLLSLEAAFDVKSENMSRIKERHGKDVAAIAKSVMYDWLKRQGKSPSTAQLISILTDAGLLEEKQAVALCTQIIPAIGLSNSGARNSDDDLLMSAAAIMNQNGLTYQAGQYRQQESEQQEHSAADSGEEMPDSSPLHTPTSGSATKMLYNPNTPYGTSFNKYVPHRIITRLQTSQDNNSAEAVTAPKILILIRHSSL